GGLAAYLAGLDAGRAHIHPARGLADHRAHALNVGVPAARGPAVRVRHIVAEARPFAAHIADGSHGIAPGKWVLSRNSLSRGLLTAVRPILAPWPSSLTLCASSSATRRRSGWPLCSTCIPPVTCS